MEDGRWSAEEGGGGVSAHLLSLTGAVVRLTPSRREIRKAARRKLLLAMICLAVMPPVVALAVHVAALHAAKMGDGRWEIGAYGTAQMEGGAR